MDLGSGQPDQERRAIALRERAEELRAAGVKFVQLEFADINGTVRGKISPLDAAVSASGFGVSSLLQAIVSGDNVCITPYSNFENSFPKLLVLPDPDTLVQWDWDPEMASVRCDLLAEDFAPMKYDPRAMLRRAEERLAAEGIGVKAALEYELFILRDDDGAVREQRFSDLLPYSRTANVYDLTCRPWFGSLAKDFLGRCATLGFQVDAFHTEYGEGMFEYVHGISNALTAADNAARARLCMKRLAAEHGLIATYMPVIGRRESDTASGAHHNISLWRDGRNLMWDEAGRTLSPTARHFAAGVLAALPDLHVLFRPWINSYRRMDRFHFSPEDASWGLDHHTAALRVIHGATPAKSSRLEVRVPGADINPYLTMAALLLSGARGIERGMEPPAYAAGDPVETNAGAPLSRSLGDAVDLFERSELARDLFGDDFVDHFTLTRRAELEAFDGWCRENAVDPKAPGVTQWERAHYLEWA